MINQVGPTRPLLLPAPRPAPSIRTQSVVPSGDHFQPSQAPAPVPTPTQALPAPNPSGLSPSAQQLVDRLGLQLKRADFEELFRDALPGTLPVVTVGTRELGGQQVLQFECNYLNEEAQELGNSSATLSRNKEGQLVYHWSKVWCDPEHQGQGFLSKLAHSALDFMQKWPSEDRVLEMGAGGYGRSDFSQTETVGRFLWARLGLFEFESEGDRQGLQHGFASWLAKKVGSTPGLSQEMADQLIESSKSWNRPEDFAAVDPPFLKFDVSTREGHHRKCSLGRAFLQDRDSPAWSGRCRFSEVGEETFQRVFRLLSMASQEKEEKPPVDPSLVAEKLLQTARDPQQNLRSRNLALELHAQLTGGTDAQLLTECSGINPAIGGPIIAAALANQNDEPKAVCRQAVSLAYRAQEEHYRKLYGVERSPHEFLKFYGSLGGDWKRVEAALTSNPGHQGSFSPPG